MNTLLTKAKAAEQPLTCTNCNGVGKRSRVVVGRYGHAVEHQVCRMCGGGGVVRSQSQ